MSKNKKKFKTAKVPLKLAFDDVLLVPQYSDITSRSQVSTRSRLAGDLFLNVPLISSNMDTVTMSEMAIAMAKLGGIGFIHRFLSIEDEVRQVEKVKRYRSHIISDPYRISESETIADAVALMDEHEVGGLMVAEDDGVLHGILTRRDVDGADESDSVAAQMTEREKMAVGEEDISVEEAKKIMHDLRVEKLPLVDRDNRVTGLIVMKDIRKLAANPQASLDSQGRLAVGGSVGVVNEYLDRADALIAAGADTLVVDVAHGHAGHVGKAVKELRKRFPDLPLIAGDVATGEGIEYLADAGADAVRVGIGPGSACTTRLVAGAGVPQFSALLECSVAAREKGVEVIADGGIRAGNASQPGGADLSKAIGAGASTAMLGSALAGTRESPGRIEERDGHLVKTYRGMASMDAFLSKQVGEGKADEAAVEYVPEGVTAVIPYRDEPAAKVIHKLVGGLRSGMAYSNARTIDEFHQKAKFVQQTSAGIGESKPHVLDRGSR